MEEYKEVKAKIPEQCAKVHGINEPDKNGFTSTSNFNWKYSRSLDERETIYALMGKSDAQPITAQSCEAVDCMHPCYG